MGSKKPYFLLVVIQVSYAIMILLSKAAFAAGMSTFVFLFYRQAIGTIVLIPLTLFLKRKEKNSISLSSFCKISILAFIGITLGLNAYGAAVDFTSATLGAAAFNCLPVTTFFFAALLRMEKVSIKRASGLAKVMGLILCIVGVTTLAFYRGPHLKPLFHHPLFESDNSKHKHPSSSHDHVSSTTRWIIGCFLLFLSSVSWGLWLVLQARFLKNYPSTLVFTCLQTLASAIQSFIVAIALERDSSQWKLGWNIRLVAVIYCGTVVVCLANYLQSWVIQARGPVFQAISTPLNLVVTILGSELLLSEGINLGSVLGAILLIVSLYSVLWGKSKEEESIRNNELCLPVVSSDRKQVEEDENVEGNDQPKMVARTQQDL